MRATPFLSFSCWNEYDCKCSILYRWTKETFMNSHCLSAGSDSLYLQLKPTSWAQSYPRKHTNFSTSFKNIIFRYHHVMQKNSSYAETEQRSICRVLHFNRQNLMFISPLNRLPLLALIENIPQNIKKWHYMCHCHFGDGNYGQTNAGNMLLTEAVKVNAPAQERHGNSLSIRGLNTQASNWEADTLPVSCRRPSEIFIANA